MIRTIALIILSIIVVIGCMILNFHEFFMDSPATLKNVSVTIAYILSWIIILTISIKIKTLIVLKYCRFFWFITLCLGLLTILYKITGFSTGLELPFVVLLFTQWYGIRYFYSSFITVSIIISFISLGMFSIAFLSSKRILNLSKR